MTVQPFALDDALGIPGARAVALLDAGLQSVLWSAGVPALGPEEMAAVVTLAGAAAGLVVLTDPADELGDVLVTSAAAFHVLRLVEDGSPQVAYLMLRRAGANLAMARHEFKQVIDAHTKRPKHLAERDEPVELASLTQPEPAELASLTQPEPTELASLTQPEPTELAEPIFEQVAESGSAESSDPAPDEPTPAATAWVASPSGALEAFEPSEGQREELEPEPEQQEDKAGEPSTPPEEPELLQELLPLPEPRQEILIPRQRQRQELVLAPDQLITDSATALLPELGPNRRPEFGTEPGPIFGTEPGPLFGTELDPFFGTESGPVFGTDFDPDDEVLLDPDTAALPRRRPNGAPNAANGSPASNAPSGNEQGADPTGNAGLPPLPDWLTVLGQPYEDDEGVLDRILDSLRHL